MKLNANQKGPDCLKKRRSAYSVCWAIKTIQKQIKTVDKYLHLAAYQAAQDTEYVHQLRVATRRAMAGIAVCHDLFNPRQATQLTENLRKIRKAAGEARDIDVFLENRRQTKENDAKQLEKIVVVLRAGVQKPIQKLAGMERQKKNLRNKAKQFFKSRKKKNVPQTSKSFIKWLKIRLRNKISKVIESKPHSLNNLSQLHKFRVSCKELRYSIETLEEFADPKLQTKTIARLKTLQDCLGQLNDQSVACHRIKQWLKKCKKPDRKPLYKQLAKEQNRLAQTVKKVGKNWSQRPIQKLEKTLKTYLENFPRKKAEQKRSK